MLDAERIEFLEIPSELKPLRLDDVLEEAIQSLRAEAVGKGLALCVAPPEGLVVEADPDHLGRMVANLISNAVKYTPFGTIEVRTEEREGDAVVEVEDTGIGMSEEEVQQLSRRFFRAGDPHVSGVAGTGLGLSIAKAIAERHGGTIRVDSTPDVGTTFR